MRTALALFAGALALVTAGGVVASPQFAATFEMTYSPSTAGSSAGIETLVTITFEERDGKTVQTFHQMPFLNVERRDSHVGGWNQAFDKEQAYAEKIAKEHVK